MPNFPFRDQILTLLSLVTPDQWYTLWVAGGGALFLLWGWWAYGLLRRAAGHVKFRGTWYDHEQFETLIKMIDEDSTRGNRVMQHDEMALLRKWRFGTDKTIQHQAGSYF